MKITKNTKGITSSVDYVDTEEYKKLLEFKEWAIDNVKGCVTEGRWEQCDMKQKLSELGLEN